MGCIDSRTKEEVLILILRENVLQTISILCVPNRILTPIFNIVLLLYSIMKTAIAC